MRCLFLLFLFASLLFCRFAYADGEGDTTGGFSGALNSGSADSFLQSDSALQHIQDLLTSDFNDSITNNFGGFQDILNVVIPSSDVSADPPVFQISQTETYGGLSIDFGMIPASFWVLLNLVSLILTGWTAFTIVLRP